MGYIRIQHNLKYSRMSKNYFNASPSYVFTITYTVLLLLLIYKYIKYYQLINYL